jgi:hypothetical protein
VYKILAYLSVLNFQISITINMFSPEDGDCIFLQNLALTDESTRRQNPKEYHLKKSSNVVCRLKTTRQKTEKMFLCHHTATI